MKQVKSNQLIVSLAVFCTAMGMFFFVEKMSSLQLDNRNTTQRTIVSVPTGMAPVPTRTVKPTDKPFDIAAAKAEFGKSVKPFKVMDADYASWQTYTNAAHKYSLKYPADWTLDTKGADVLETYDNESCCMAAVLNIKKGNTYWKIIVDGLYTGGPGYTQEEFYEQCKPLEDSPCKFSYYGPIDLGKTVSERIFLRILTNTKDGKILVGTVGQEPKGLWGVSPIFYSRALPQNNNRFDASVTSINYLGDDINSNMTVLNKITNSVKFFE
jgi:hypothetical protein